MSKLTYTDLMARVDDVAAAQQAMERLLGFRTIDRQSGWTTLEHPHQRGRVTLTAGDFGSYWALACRQDETVQSSVWESCGFPTPSPERIEEEGFSLLRSPSGLFLLVYG